MKNEYIENVVKSFNHCAEWIFDQIPKNATATLSLDAESTLYVRFNNHRIRQNSHVDQAIGRLLITKDKKSFRFLFSLTSDVVEDLKKIKIAVLKILNDWDQLLSENVDFKVADAQTSTTYLWGETKPLEVIDYVAKAVAHLDFTGLVTIGPVLNCVRNSLGVHHQFLTDIVTVDYSLYDGPRAVKGLYSSRQWHSADFSDRLLQSQNLLESMKKTKVDLKPDFYRVYLAPAAVSELAQMLNWGAVSQRSYKLGRNPLKRLIENEMMLSEQLSIAEDFELGLGPQFNNLGEKAPTRLPVIQQGQVKNLFTSTKTAIEFNLESNLADEDEGFRAMNMATGLLRRENIFAELGTGIFISNLHYLNWSNPIEARITGMTRYACFWVQNGQIQGPIADLRFDDTLFDLWGAELESITDFAELEPQTSTYFQRQLGGKKTPGMLIKKMKFTL